MKKLIYDTTNEKLLPWPRIDNEPVVDLDSTLLEMELIEEEEPDYDLETEQLEATEVIDVEERTVVRGWEVIPIPAPTKVPRYQFLGQLGKEIIEGDNSSLQQLLLDQGTTRNLLLFLVRNSEEISNDLKPIALNEIEEAQSFNRNHPFIEIMGPLFGYNTEEEKDDFFRRAVLYRFGA